ncbi:hypothetical protein CC78DRAFT_574442 [Lojkania enalia]|uniref:Uncharacterized protein n=1 Tax=Lojkania enalia TaxID=147567 RepID=A0A9P4TR75_9PLEO|nr:hypothetical protein CC78DRAFT_574442 [Didymosphaeria enalia]
MDESTLLMGFHKVEKGEAAAETVQRSAESGKGGVEVCVDSLAAVKFQTVAAPSEWGKRNVQFGSREEETWPKRSAESEPSHVLRQSRRRASRVTGHGSAGCPCATPFTHTLSSPGGLTSPHIDPIPSHLIPSPPSRLRPPACPPVRPRPKPGPGPRTGTLTRTWWCYSLDALGPVTCIHAAALPRPRRLIDYLISLALAPSPYSPSRLLCKTHNDATTRTAPADLVDVRHLPPPRYRRPPTLFECLQTWPCRTAALELLPSARTCAASRTPVRHQPPNRHPTARLPLFPHRTPISIIRTRVRSLLFLLRLP